MQIRRVELADDIMRAGQLAAALEASGWPKPGNVHRRADFPETRFEHFIAASISLGPSLKDGALRGAAVEAGEIDATEAGVGRLVKRAVLDMNSWQKGGNTHLGTILLFAPMSVAGGMTLMHGKKFDLQYFRQGFRKLMESTTPQDATEVYEAIAAARPRGLGSVESADAPDLASGKEIGEIVTRGLTLYDVMKTSSRWDTIASELVDSLKITLNVGYPALCEVYFETHDVNIATVHTYLRLLSQFPDTFVARNVGLKHTTVISRAVEIGMDKAREISLRAAQILQMGGLATARGRKNLARFDNDLRKNKQLRPGTTADLTAASLMVTLMCGLRF